MPNFLKPNFSDLPGCRAISRNYVRGDVACEHIDVSIITPYYNTEEFFVETFISLQAQSLQNWEWVIVDDGSTDQESVDRLAKIATKDNRIKVIRQINAGPSAARNKSVSHSVGRYLCLLDSDDMVEPTYLEKCVWFLESNPQFAFCNSYSVVFGEQELIWTKGFERGRGFIKANSGPPISVIRRAAYNDCGGFDESIRFGHEDWDFWLAMAKAGHWGYTIPELLQWYRKRGNGRYEQIMKSGNVNHEFEQMIHRKYNGLDKQFPNPSRCQSKPYAKIETTSTVCNPLAKSQAGRRVMFLLPWMVTGGADRVNLDLIEGLTSKGHDVTICATLLADHNWESVFKQFTPDIFILPNILKASDYPRFLVYLIKSRQIDSVVITGSTIGYQLLPYLRAVLPDVAFVDMCHVEEPNWLNGGHPRFGVGYQDVLDLNIVTTEHLSHWMKDLGADEARIRVMYTGVRPVDEVQSSEMHTLVRGDFNISLDVPVIVFAGRLCEQKRPLMLAEILKTLHDSGLVFRALIIGYGEQKRELSRLLSKYNLTSCVQMLGSVSHQRWLDVLSASDILLMPSQYEGISVALLESMAAGVVPVVAKVGGQDEIVRSDAGVLIPHGLNELEVYVDTIRRLILDPIELELMSKQCKSIAASKLSWDGMIDNFISHLNEAHRFRIEHPRHLISPNFGRELVSQSLKLQQLEVVTDWKPNSTSVKVQVIARLAVFVSQTWLGKLIIRNQFLKTNAKWFLKKLTNQNAG